MSYSVVLSGPAKRQLRDLPASMVGRVDEAISKLRLNARPVGVKKLLGPKQRFRVRVGTYRIVYEIDDQNRRVLVVLIVHRKDAYKKHIA